MVASAAAFGHFTTKHPGGIACATRARSRLKVKG
ncbi:unnamed protein product, partial [marine sediment metagenome]